MQNITLSADEQTIEAAKRVAADEHTTLNEQFCLWLESYAKKKYKLQQFDETLQLLDGKLKVGKKLTREQMNAR